jgi:hypothetical protein
VSVSSQVFPLITTLGISIVIACGWFALRRLRKDLDARIAHVIWKDFRQLYIPEVFVFARNRLLSVRAMVFDIFMKRIRDLSRSEAQALQKNSQPQNQDREADSGDVDAQRRGNTRVIEARIVKIPGQGKLVPFQPIVGWLTPSPAMLEVTRIAKEVGTQLWFNSNGQHKPATIMGALRLSGEITLCASVLQHLISDRRNLNSPVEDPTFAPELQEVYERAREYWQKELMERARKFQ